MRGFLLVVATAALVAGCGGNSKDSSSAAPPPATTGTQPPATADPQAELDAFLADFKRLRDEGIATTDSVQAALDKVDTDDDASMVAAGKTLEQSVQEFSDNSNELAALVPPEGLAKEWAAYVSGADSRARLIDQMATDLNGKDVASIANWETTVFPGIDKAANRTNAFRLALIAYASKNGLKTPPWVKKIGTGEN